VNRISYTLLKIRVIEAAEGDLVVYVEEMVNKALLSQRQRDAPSVSRQLQ